MFDHSDTNEAQQCRVEIVDVDVEVFLFLCYLYTGKIDQLERFAPELLTVADMYQMDCLKSLFEHYLYSTLTIDNVSQWLIHVLNGGNHQRRFDHFLPRLHSYGRAPLPSLGYHGKRWQIRTQDWQRIDGKSVPSVLAIANWQNIQEH